MKAGTMLRAAEFIRRKDKAFVLKYIQTTTLGLMDGSVSTLAPLFATVFATGDTRVTFWWGSQMRGIINDIYQGWPVAMQPTSTGSTPDMEAQRGEQNIPTPARDFEDGGRLTLPGFRWTDAEMDILRAKYGKCSWEELTRALPNRTKKSIRSMARIKGIRFFIGIEEAREKVDAIPLPPLFWIVGLLEGEGWFRFSGRTLRVAIKMTDRDVVERFTEILPFDDIQLREQPPPNPHWKTQYMVEIYGAKAQALMERILPYMGERRRRRIISLLKAWNERQG